MSLDEDLQLLSENGIDIHAFIEATANALRQDAVVRPCPGLITQVFGIKDAIYTNAWNMHLGMDVAVPTGTVIMAAKIGTVEWVGDAGPLGLTVVLWHPGGGRSVYAHLNKTFVAPRQTVFAGATIGKSGYSGLVQPPGPEGAHLHFETWVQCSVAGENATPYTLTRDDPTALPADPMPIWRGRRWPRDIEGVHTSEWTP